MNEKRNPRFSPPAVGGASLLAVFAVLCLTVFALLSLATVRSDSRLAEASVKAVSDYYAADCKAQEILARLRSGEIPDGVNTDGDVYSYSCRVSDTLRLDAEVRINGSGYSVLQWQTVPAGKWEIDESLDLWDGEEPNTRIEE